MRRLARRLVFGGAATVTAAMMALTSAPVAGADEAFPIGVAPEPLSCAMLTFPGRAGTWPVPMHAPDRGIGLLTMPRASAAVQKGLPERIDLRTETTGFNISWQYALFHRNLYVKSSKGDGDWRIAPVPQCIRDRITGLSVDGSRLVVLARGNRVFTLESADLTPELWWWTSRFGSPIWLDPAGTRVRPSMRAWSLSWLDPMYTSLIPFRQKGFWTDSAGLQHPVGGAGVTTVFTLSQRGDRIYLLDPWLPGADPLKPSDKRFNADYSYEMQGPLDGRFQAVNLSSAGSTTFVINKYGDMFTRLWDFDISGADTLFFSYTPDPQTGATGGPNNFEAFFSQYPALRGFFPTQFAKFTLPTPAWLPQPKVPGEITSTISVHQTGGRSAQRELRVEGRKDGVTGYWHKKIDPKASWSFSAVKDAKLTASVLDNRSGDTSALTMVGPSGVDYAGRIEPGATIGTTDFDHATETQRLKVCAGGACVNVTAYIAPTPRPGWQPAGLTSTTRLYQGFLKVEPADRAAVNANPKLRAAITSLIPKLDRSEPIILTASTEKMTVFTLDKKLVTMPRQR
ncbi:hypothetical protein [Gordonia sp. (in: high G+C Gram-positive bacteria)]|uniref:hypothetical protein n=1 Tax=Gordonia sp. (in: high G+C Gram-positive bacteria) TaxID=84139 RepID=UPI003C7765BA